MKKLEEGSWDGIAVYIADRQPGCFLASFLEVIAEPFHRHRNGLRTKSPSRCVFSPRVAVCLAVFFHCFPSLPFMLQKKVCCLYG